MKQITTTLCLLFILFFSVNGANDTIILQKETFIYSIKGNDTLRLDKYAPTVQKQDTSPCVIFVFGGGFAAGARDQHYYNPYFKLLTENGYTVISIDYRLALKGLSLNPDWKYKDYIALFKNTIMVAVEDLFDATQFVLNHADSWKVDVSKIVASGSSAGAVAVLQGEYEISSQGVVAKRLPENFNYAGVIAFAGAIFSDQGDLQWSQNTAPIQLFHGDADRNVPYDKLKFGKIGLYGSKHIAKRLDKANLPYYFYTAENSSHILAISPVYSNQQEILSFLDKYVMKRKREVTIVNMTPMDKSKVKKNFTIFDYLRTNYAPKKK